MKGRTYAMMPVERFTLSNGLRVHLTPKDREVTSMCIALPYGSIDEPSNLRGVAHYLEHTVLNGTPTYPTQKELSDVLGSQSNAQTGHTHTRYYTTTTGSQAATALRALGEAVFSPLLTDEAIELERGPIIEEMSYLDEHRLGVLVASLAFKGHPAEVPIIGKKPTVQSIQPAEIRKVHATTYSPRIAVLAVSGKITKSLRRAIDSLEKYKAFYVEQKTPEARRTPKIQGQTIKVIKGHKPQAMIQMAFSAPLMTDTENDTLAYLASMYLGYDQSSRLMQAVRTKHGLCYGIHSMVESTSAFGMGHIYTQVDPKNIKKTIDIVWSEIESIKHHGISTDEFKRLITSYKTAATLAGDDLEFDAKTDAEYMVERVPHRSRAHSDRMLSRLCPDDIVQTIANIFDCENMILGIETPTSLRPSDVRAIL